MIEKIYVDGFKTLTDFELSLLPGLNILVGPNGSGKTNIVSFFEFLAFLMETDASEATSRAGGAGAIFRRIGDKFHDRITAKVCGFMPVPDNIEKVDPDEVEDIPKKYWSYEYEFCLVFPELRDAVLFDTQVFRLKVIDDAMNHPFFEAQREWDLHVKIGLDEKGSSKAKVYSLHKDLARDWYLPRSKKGGENFDYFEDILGRFLKSNTSIVRMVAQFSPDLWKLQGDLSGGQTYNIIPSRVKQSEDSAKPPGISKDGYGLAATIYALKRIAERDYYQMRFFSNRKDISASPDTLAQLKEYLRLVNSAIEDFDVTNDSFDNQLKLKFKVKGGGADGAWIPVSQISDGTLKWIALVTAALTEQAVFSIEEPENYLHPTLQKKIVTVLRDILFNDEDELKVTILTTHSETLLNSCRPKELIITYFEDGGTKATRCSNADEVSDEINRTGFGLGYYYLTDALIHE